MSYQANMTSFQERQKNLFNHLKDAEDQCSFSKSNKSASSPLNVVLDKHTYRRIKKEMKPFRGRESIFKRPEANLLECLRARTVPDFIKNPKKWVYYSLSDVTPEQMSDSTNTATGLAFIREMEERESSKMEVKEAELDETGVFKKPTFKPSATVKKNQIVKEVITFKNNKVIMPEYVVGVTQKKEKKGKIHKKTSNEECDKEKKSTIKLNHLYEDD